MCVFSTIKWNITTVYHTYIDIRQAHNVCVCVQYMCVYIILYINVWTHKSHTSHSFHLYFVFVVFFFFFLLVLFVFSSSSSFLAFIIFLFCSHISFDMHSMASNSVYGKLIHTFSPSLAPSCALECVHTHTQTHTNSFRSSLVSHTWKAHTFPLCNRWKCLPWYIYNCLCENK